MDSDQAAEQRKLQLPKLDEIFLEASENFQIYKEKYKVFMIILLLGKSLL